MNEIINFLDEYLEKSNIASIGAVEANKLLEKSGILKDNKNRAGKPLRDLLRKGLIPHAYQIGGKGSAWIIPHSKMVNNQNLNSNTLKKQSKQIIINKNEKFTNKPNNFSDLIKQLEKARLNYKPEKIKFLLIAEAPPDNLERFFYYENVSNYDYLFLGIAQLLFPKLKNLYIESNRNPKIKELILKKIQQDGFYLLDLAPVPKSLLKTSLRSQLLYLNQNIKNVINKKTKIILIKTNVYDIAFETLNQNFKNVINCRIPFPSQGWQKEFLIKFKKALEIAGN